ncbi:class I SAM-dependent methyltransferase [Sphingomonas sp.]|uniref:class I SAM-dependent methyltransferase n=1 Tax=Sphingomonas sp. TaxID=28214 RepID=UPI003AFF713F
MSDRPPTQLATDDNFEAGLYLAANRDVAAHVARGGSAWTHFVAHGRREGRRQLLPEAAGLAGSRQRRKYERFAQVLDAAKGVGGGFAFVAERGAFPVRYGGDTYDLGAYEAEPANPGLGSFVDHVRAHPDRLFADIGCGRRSERLDNCLYLEVYPSPSADLVMAPAARYPIADAALDGIGCFAVLEHVPDPHAIAREFARMVRPGGTIFIDYPFLVPVHGYPSHYFNATREGLLSLFAEAFETVEVETLPNQTPDHAIRWQLSALRDAIGDEGVRAEFDAMSVGRLLAEEPGGAFWRRVLASVPPHAIAGLAAGNTLVARRR